MGGIVSKKKPPKVEEVPREEQNVSEKPETKESKESKIETSAYESKKEEKHESETKVDNPVTLKKETLKKTHSSSSGGSKIWKAPASKDIKESKRFRGAKKGFKGFRAMVQDEDEEEDENEGSTGERYGLKLDDSGPKLEAEKSQVMKNLQALPFANTEDFEEMLDSMQEAKIEAGTKLMQEGKRCPFVFIVVEGEFLLGGEPALYANEQALLTSEPASTTFEAVTDGRVWVTTRLKYQQATVVNLKRKLEKGESLLKNITEIPGLKELPKSQRQEIANALKQVEFRKGEYLMRQGDEGHTMFFIEFGEVTVQRVSAEEEARRKITEEKDGGNDSAEVIARRTAGEYIGEGALLDNDDSTTENSGYRNADVVAATDVVKCLSLGRHEFQEHMGSLKDLFEHNLCCRVLKSLDIMKDLTDSQLMTIVSTLEECSFDPGEYIVHQGEEGEIFYIVKDGMLDCNIQEEEEEELKSIGTLISGDYFGEGALLTNEPRRCNVVAVGSKPTKLWGLSRSNFESCFSVEMKENLGKTFTARRKANNGGDVEVEWEHLQKIRTLGSGSYGTVDLVRNKITGGTLALKRIRKATVVAKKQQRFVKNERELLSNASSDFIVNLVRTFNQGDSVYMLTEVCLGGELYTLMKDTVDQKPWPEEGEEDLGGCFEIYIQARFFTSCIALAIEYLHSEGIIHRDIKPENLLLTPKGYLKLADFGFAKKIHDQRTYSLCGTPEYTAPEVYKRCGHGKGVDWWALGVILYEMASGFSPFHVSSQNSWDCYIEVSKYEKFYPNIQFPKNFSPEISDLILRLMHPNPTKRYGTRTKSASVLKQHPYFGEVVNEEGKTVPALDWESVQNQEYILPEEFRSRAPEFGLDTNNFEECLDRHEHDADNINPANIITDSSSWDAEF